MPEWGPLSHASRASSPFRGAFSPCSFGKPPLKGEGDRLRWRGSSMSQVNFIGRKYSCFFPYTQKGILNLPNHEICCDFTHIIVTGGIDIDSNTTPLCGAV